MSLLGLLKPKAGEGRIPAPPPVFKTKEDYERMWLKISALPLDDPKAPKPMSLRLAQEQGWTHEFAKRVLEEYRRFVFLMVVSPRSVTPSTTVDECWHVHLIYSKSYWVEMCLYTLGVALHHNPGTGAGEVEKKGFEDDYQYTLRQYKHFFGDYPMDIWGPDNGRNVKPKG